MLVLSVRGALSASVVCLLAACETAEQKRSTADAAHTTISSNDSPLQTGVPAIVGSVISFDNGTTGGPAIFVATNESNGEKIDSHIYRWNGRQWNDRGAFPAANLQFFVHGRAPRATLYAMANHPTATPENHWLRWEGARWVQENNPPINAIRLGDSIWFDDGGGKGSMQYVAGTFQFPGQEGFFGIARFNGETWEPLPEPEDGERAANIGDLEVLDDGAGNGPALYAAGTFYKPGQKLHGEVAKWNARASAWEFFSGSGFEGGCFTPGHLAVFSDRTGNAPTSKMIIAAGSFNAVDGINSPGVAALRLGAKGVTRQWVDLNGGISGGHLFNEIYSTAFLTENGQSVLYVAGNFGHVGGVDANFVAKWDGHRWHAIDGFDSWPALHVLDDGSGPALYATGAFERIGNVIVNNIAKWHNGQWHALTGPMRLTIDD